MRQSCRSGRVAYGKGDTLQANAMRPILSLFKKSCCLCVAYLRADTQK
jgi:hypothetical protein